MRRRWQATLVAALMMVATTAFPGASSAGSAGRTAAPVNTRSMWLWDAAPAAEVITWATRRNISEILVHVAPSALTDGSLAGLRELKERAGARRIELRALGGEPGWPTTTPRRWPGSGPSSRPASSTGSTWTWSRT